MHSYEKTNGRRNHAALSHTIITNAIELKRRHWLIITRPTLHEHEYRREQNFIITIIKLDSAQKGAPCSQIHLKLLLVMHIVHRTWVVAYFHQHRLLCSLVRSKEEMSHGLAQLLCSTDWMHSSTKYELPR